MRLMIDVLNNLLQHFNTALFLTLHLSRGVKSPKEKL